jgi:hypothetical protein
MLWQSPFGDLFPVPTGRNTAALSRQDNLSASASVVMPQFRSRGGRSTAILAVRMGRMPMLRSPKLRSCELIEKGNSVHTIIQ